MPEDQDIKRFLQIGHYEGISYILLLGVAMPLKYLAGMPQAVKIMGSIHGILFVGFVFLIVWLLQQKKLNIKGAVMAFLMSLIPFGTFYLTRLFKKSE